MWHTATYCNTMQYTATHCNTLFLISNFHLKREKSYQKDCNTPQHTTTHSNTQRHTATRSTWYQSSSWSWRSLINKTATPQHTTTHCNTHTATHYNTPQHTAICSTWYPTSTWSRTSPTKKTATHRNTLRYTATHYNILQNTATHCNALQHTATHSNTLQHALPDIQLPLAAGEVPPRPDQHPLDTKESYTLLPSPSTTTVRKKKTKKIQHSDCRGTRNTSCIRHNLYLLKHFIDSYVVFTHRLYLLTNTSCVDEWKQHTLYFIHVVFKISQHKCMFKTSRIYSQNLKQVVCTHK